MVATCLVTREVIRLKGDELRTCPFRCDDGELFISFYAIAEISCFLVLGWPLPRRMIDLFVEARRQFNGGVSRFERASLLSVMEHFGLPTIGAVAKKEMQDLAIRGGPYAEQELADLVDYCAEDTDALGRLVPRLIGNYSREDLAHALIAGRYMVAAAAVEHHGIPIDAPLLRRLTRHWRAIRLDLIEAVDAPFGVYEDGHFRHARFDALLKRLGISWPRTATGKPSIEDKVFRLQADRHPEIAPLWELKHTLDDLKLNSLTVGKDGRNRTMLSAFRSITGRNQPSNAEFVFGPAKWIRGLIKPGPGRAVVYADWSAQEVSIAAALSGDARMWADYETGDPHLAFAKVTGLAPPDATDKSHKRERDACKQLVFGAMYGISDWGFAAKSGLHISRARTLLQQHRQRYARFWAWAEERVERLMLGLPLRTPFGWRIQYPPGWNIGRAPKKRRHNSDGGPPRPGDDEASINPRSALNWTMQAGGADMMRLAVSMAVEDGLMICAPVHDALLLEAPTGEVEAQSARLREIMARASELVLGKGKRCRVDIKIVKHPDRYMDERGAAMFATVMQLLEKAEQAAEAGSPAADKSSTDCRQIDARCRQNIDPQGSFFSSYSSDSSEKGF